MIGALALLAGVLLGLGSAALPTPAWLLAAGASAALALGYAAAATAPPCGVSRWLLAGLVLASVVAHSALADRSRAGTLGR